eukprot:GEMP01081954.1.p1 GENE.GEMP01081954.1~~GEMP01081954.1.p1  ORF type:complete len:241 (+),score=23.03 GEMP01081954.1:45-767(+)
MDRDGRQRGRGRKGGATQHAHGQQYCSPEYAEGDFKEEEPDKYQAFVAKAISWNGFVASVSLGKRMCVDRHVPDLLPCLDSWLRSELHRPYNLGTFDLSNNALSDDSIKKIFIALRNLDVSVHELNLGTKKRKTLTYSCTFFDRTRRSPHTPPFLISPPLAPRFFCWSTFTMPLLRGIFDRNLQYHEIGTLVPARLFPCPVHDLFPEYLCNGPTRSLFPGQELKSSIRRREKYPWIRGAK